MWSSSTACCGAASTISPRPATRCERRRPPAAMMAGVNADASMGSRAAAARRAIVSVSNVTKTFPTRDGGEPPVLEGISLDVAPGEIVALLGKSGSGKSTLLRCIAGLVQPSSGTVSYRGKPLVGINPGVSLVFQTVALLPWLTVQQNVEIGLEAQGIPPAERTKRALEAI